MLKKIGILLVFMMFIFAAGLFQSEIDTQAAGGVEVYRLYNPKTGEHLFTYSKNEVKVLSTTHGWTDEGLGWEAPASGTPVYRLYNPGGFHLYTQDQNEIKVLTTQRGWQMDNDGKPMYYAGGNYPIYRLYSPKLGQHLLTTDQNEYNVLKNYGWNQEGVAAYATNIPGNHNPNQLTPGDSINYDYVRGVWFSYLDWQTYLKEKNENDFKTTFTNICDKTIANNCNTMYVHVRSHNDAVYPSNIYPTSTEMLGGAVSYDPLKIMVEIAHSKGLSFHAWINPYGYRNGSFAGDPALITEDNIIAGIDEIVSNYQVDGIHFDDYFPVYDKAVHNSMVKRAYDTAHAKGKLFGISPQGNIENNRNMGADIDTWMSVPGYIDYITPQIYWTDQYGNNADTTMYSDRLSAWVSLNKLNIPMYIGLATYRTANFYGSDKGWTLSQNNLVNQVKKANDFGCDGYIHFRYADFDRAAADIELGNLRAAGL